MNMNQKGFANIILVVVIVAIIAVGGYFVFVKKSEPVAQQPTPSPTPTTQTPTPTPIQKENSKAALPVPSTPTLTFNQGTKPFIQINFDWSIAKLFNIYRSTSATNGWQKIISNLPSSAHTAVDYDYPKDANVLYYRIVSVDKQGKESTPSPVASIAVTAESETASWNSYTYSSIESGILPNMTFKYPTLFGNNPTLISSRNTNRPGNISEDWGGFFEFNPTGAFGDRGLRIEFFKRVNSENSFESYVSKSATSGGWGLPKYFQAGSYRVARIRFASSSHYDADVGQYFVELSNKSILAISTSGDKKFLYDDDQGGNSTRDKIISTLVIGQ